MRVPDSPMSPNAPALTDPLIASPSTVALPSSVIGIGTVMFMVQWSVLPSTVPSVTSIEPSPPASLTAAASAGVPVITTVQQLGAGRRRAAALAGGATYLGIAQLGEAMAARVAGVTAPILTWLFPPGADLAAAVNDVAADKERAANFGRAGRERAIRDFSWATIAAQTVDIYRSLI